MRTLRGWLMRVSGLFNRGARDQELQDELESHLQMHIEDNLRAGMKLKEARRDAVIRLGGIEYTKDAYRDQRGIPVFETWWRDLRYSVRTLGKNPGFTFVVVLTLALAMALTTSTLATVNAYLIRSLPFPNASRIYHVRYAPPGPYEPRGMSAIDWEALKDVVEETIQSSSTTVYLMESGSVNIARMLQVSSGFIRGLGVQPALGRTFVLDEYEAGPERAVMIGYHLWRDRFGMDPRILGRRFSATREADEIDEPLRIVGVLPAGFWFGRESTAKVDLLTPLRAPPRSSRTYMIRLRDGVSAAVAEKRITDAAKSVGSDFRPGWAGVQLESMHDRYVSDLRPTLVVVTLAVGILVLLVCANVAVLVLLRTMRRRKEMAVRTALGAARIDTMRLLAAEALLLCGAALAAGLVFSGTTLRALAPIIEEKLGKAVPASPAAIHIDATVLFVVSGLSLLVAIALTFLPLLAPWERRVANALKSHGTATSDGRMMRRSREALIAFEIGGSVVLLAACALMLRSAVNLMVTDLGFNPEHVLRVGVRLPARSRSAAELHQFYASLMERMPQDPSSHVTVMSAFPPFYPANKHRIEAPGSTEEQTTVGRMSVGAGYFGLYGVPVIQGREFTTSDRLGQEAVAVVSGTLAQRLWPRRSAIGMRMRVSESEMPDDPLGEWRTVIGVVGDIRQGYDDADLRDVYLPFLQAPTRFASVHVRTSRPLLFWEQTIQATVARLDPYAQVGAATSIVSEDRRRSATEFMAAMFTGLGMFAALLAVLGIYGVTAYAARQREREIAIRVAVGGSREAIVGMFLKDGAISLISGLTLGGLGALGALQALEKMVYGVKPFDLTTMSAVCGVLTLAALLAIWWPARQAAEANPLKVLKEG